MSQRGGCKRQGGSLDESHFRGSDSESHTAVGMFGGQDAAEVSCKELSAICWVQGNICLEIDACLQRLVLNWRCYHKEETKTRSLLLCCCGSRSQYRLEAPWARTHNPASPRILMSISSGDTTRTLLLGSSEVYHWLFPQKKNSTVTFNSDLVVRWCPEDRAMEQSTWTPELWWKSFIFSHVYIHTAAFNKTSFWNEMFRFCTATHPQRWFSQTEVSLGAIPSHWGWMLSGRPTLQREGRSTGVTGYLPFWYTKPSQAFSSLAAFTFLLNYILAKHCSEELKRWNLGSIWSGVNSFTWIVTTTRIKHITIPLKGLKLALVERHNINHTSSTNFSHLANMSICYLLFWFLVMIEGFFWSLKSFGLQVSHSFECWVEVCLPWGFVLGHGDAAGAFSPRAAGSRCRDVDQSSDRKAGGCESKRWPERGCVQLQRHRHHFSHTFRWFYHDVDHLRIHAVVVWLNGGCRW